MDGVNEHAVGDAGNEVADSLMAGERGHGVAMGGAGERARCVLVIGFLKLGFKGAFPGIAAAGYGGVLIRGAGLIVGCAEDEACFGFGHKCFLPLDGAESSVRRMPLIICRHRGQAQGSGVRDQD